jgi:hypothetical protein
MFICSSADVFIGQWAIYGASIRYGVWAEGTQPAETAWGGSVVVPTWLSGPMLAGKTGEVWFDTGVRQVEFVRVDRTLAFFRGIGSPPSRTGGRPSSATSVVGE